MMASEIAVPLFDGIKTWLTTALLCGLLFGLTVDSRAQNQPPAEPVPVEKPVLEKPQDDPPAVEEFLLRYKLEPDQVLTFAATTDFTQSQIFEKQRSQIGLKRTDLVSARVRDVDDKGQSRLEVTWDAIRVEGRFGNEPLTYDSRSTDSPVTPTAKAVARVYERMGPTPLQLVLSPVGQIVSLEGYAERFQRDMLTNFIASQCALGGTNASARIYLGEQFLVLPEKAVPLGGKWESVLDLETPGIGRALGKHIYTLVAREKTDKADVFRIGIETRCTFDLTINQQGARVTGRMEVIESSGTCHFDALAGRIVDLKHAHRVSGKLAVLRGDTEVPLQIEQSHSVSVAPVAEKPSK